jgi:hypothetical protein
VAGSAAAGRHEGRPDGPPLSGPPCGVIASGFPALLPRSRISWFVGRPGGLCDEGIPVRLPARDRSLSADILVNRLVRTVAVQERGWTGDHCNAVRRRGAGASARRPDPPRSGSGLGRYGQRCGAVDIRPAAQRAEEGEVPGAVIVERNPLEWPFDPRSRTVFARLPRGRADPRPARVPRGTTGRRAHPRAAAAHDLVRACGGRHTHDRRACAPAAEQARPSRSLVGHRARSGQPLVARATVTWVRVR